MIGNPVQPGEALCWYCEEPAPGPRFLRVTGFLNGQPVGRIWCGSCGATCEAHTNIYGDFIEPSDYCQPCETADNLSGDPINQEARKALLRIGVEERLLW